MKYLVLLLSLPVFFAGCRKENVAPPAEKQEKITVRVIQLNDKELTDSIKMLADTTIVDIKKLPGKIIATAYYHTIECGKYTAKAEKKGGSLVLVLNDASNPCNGTIKYYKTEAVIENPEREYAIVKDRFITNILHGENVQHHEDKYAVGDVNNDKIPDTATVIYDILFDKNNNSRGECGRRVCIIKADFGSKIAPIEADTYGMMIGKAPDVNGDGANEIIVATHWLTSGHMNIDLYTYKGNKWEVLASTGVHFMKDDVSLDNRVLKENGKYYLIGEKWADNNAEIVEDKVLIKSKK